MIDLDVDAALAALATPAGVAAIGIVTSLVAGLVQTTGAMSDIRPEVPRSLRVVSRNSAMPTAIFTPEGRRKRAQGARYLAVGLSFIVGRGLSDRVFDGDPRVIWGTLGVSIAALFWLLRADLAARSERRRGAGTIYDRDDPVTEGSALEPLPERIGPEDRERCPCCGYPTLRIVGESGEVGTECPLCDYDGLRDAPDLVERRQRFKDTLTSQSTHEIEAWGGEPPTPEESVVKRALIERFDDMERSGEYQRWGRWAEIRRLEKDLDELAFRESEAHEQLIPPDEADDDRAEDGDPGADSADDEETDEEEAESVDRSKEP